MGINVSIVGEIEYLNNEMSRTQLWSKMGVQLEKNLGYNTNYLLEFKEEIVKYDMYPNRFEKILTCNIKEVNNRCETITTYQAVNVIPEKHYKQDRLTRLWQFIKGV